MAQRPIHTEPMPQTFDVFIQHSIGTVVVDEYGDGPSWREAAYTLIARQADEGMYSFPVPGGTETVIVSRSLVGD